MRQVIAALAVVAATALASVLPTPAHAVRPPTPVWGAVGDSITYGLGTTGCSVDTACPAAYPVQATVWSVGNPGQGLVTACLVCDRFEVRPLVESFPDELDSARAAHVTDVVVEIGINDLSRGPSDADMESAYTSLVRDGAAVGIRVYLSTLTPFGPERSVGPGVEAQRERLNAWIRAHRSVVDYAATLGGDTLAPAFDSGDGLHPGDAGASAMAHALQRFETSPGPVSHLPIPVCVRAPCPR